MSKFAGMASILTSAAYIESSTPSKARQFVMVVDAILSEADGYDDWKAIYNLCFGGLIGRAQTNLSKEAGMTLTWADPDRDYEHDARAYLDAALEQFNAYLAGVTHIDEIMQAQA